MPNAISGVTSSSPPAGSLPGGQFNRGALGGALGGAMGGAAGARGSLVRVVSPDELNQRDADAASVAASAARRQMTMPDIGSYIRQRWMLFRNHRNQGNNPINDRLLRAQRMFEGKYDPDKLFRIKEFGGSEVYARLVAVKCRGATSLLRDVYLGPDRPWSIEPQPDPPVPPEIRASIMQLLASEVATMQQAGQPVLGDQVHVRMMSLLHAAQQAARRNAMAQADAASDKVEDILRMGGFYDALAEFLVDLPLFPYAVMKGPVVRMRPRLTWVQGQPVVRNQPVMTWERVNPFNFYWSPGASRIEDAEIIETHRLTRADLNDLIGLPGYDQNAVRMALQDYANGLREWLDYPDVEEAFNENREDPTYNISQMIDAIEYTGNIQGSMLLAQGVDPKRIPDPDRDYSVNSWVVGRHTIKTQLNPNPRQQSPYYITSFEKVPGTVIGHGLPDILEDLQEIANATLRALVNNMGISSGPQVVVNTDRLAPTENPDDLYPWKRWKTIADPMSAAAGDKAIEFFQPPSNVQELLATYTAISNLADDISAIPRYVTGESMSGGAGRTASGLSMLMGNSSKVLQTVASNVDGDVLRKLLFALYDMIMLTDTSGMLTGEEDVVVNGVNVALQRETERQKQLQFLQITGNPIDAPIVGQLGRARVLRAVAKNLGLPDDVVPDDDAIQKMIQEHQMQAAAAAQNGPQPGQPGKPGKPSAGAQAQGNQPPHPTPTQLADHAPPMNSFQQQPQGIPTNGR